MLLWLSWTMNSAPMSQRAAVCKGKRGRGGNPNTALTAELLVLKKSGKFCNIGKLLIKIHHSPLVNIAHVKNIFHYRNIFGPVLGSSPAQNPPVLPSMQPGFGGCDYYNNDACKLKIKFLSGTNSHIYKLYKLILQLLTCVSSSRPIHKSLCCCSRCPGHGHKPFPDQWQSSSCRCVCTLKVQCILISHIFSLNLRCNPVTLTSSFVICQSN